MGDEGCGADLACIDECEDFSTVTAIDTADFEGEVLALRPVCERELLVFYVS